MKIKRIVNGKEVEIELQKAELDKIAKDFGIDNVLTVNMLREEKHASKRGA